ncbi:unnamed protein product [Adineta steineri]|uniref:Inosine/uridine-preferring nucleoside hydrolase domain-containing protein n=1 Tax=Adineta steineri TaxID=433720 RepID=A0A813NFK1_9BILA|nr:unnamed protein product [Adineta steineri]CAF1412498.1 unnamed protein product [Adineta steineri]CAF3640731.1 unnamed protein product [Adineta steineri]CAF3887553.1 unnamed protein product [Adineta steineri]
MKGQRLSLFWLLTLFLPILTSPIPTILDTDIGTDYDDQMALSYILSNPAVFDLKLVVCSTFNTLARAQIVAKTLAIYGRYDIPIAIGQNTGINNIWEYEWAEDYTLEQFQKQGGTVFENGEEALYNEMQKATSDNIYHVIEISPATSLGHVLQRIQPEILKNIRLFAMAGSIYRGYGNSSQPSKEYNVAEDISAARTMFNGSWAYFGLAPLDCTNFMQFNGREWQTFLSFRNESVHVQLILDSYSIWYKNGGKDIGAMLPYSPEIGTSTMHDVLAAILSAFYPRTITMTSRQVSLLVTLDGFTNINTTEGKSVNTSLSYKTPDPYKSTEVIGIITLNSIIYT